VWLKGSEHFQPIQEMRLWFVDDTAGTTGTNVPAVRRECRLAPGALVPSDWIPTEVEAFDYGSPAVSPDVDVIGMELTLGNSVAASYAAIGCGFDLLEIAASSNPNYTDSPGTLLENPADCVRHFIADHCELGHDAIGSSFATTRTRLAGISWAGAVTVHGWTFNDILAGMAFEGRGNIFETDTVDETVYQFKVGNIIGGIPFYSTDGISVTADEFRELRAATRPGDELVNSMRAFYRWDPFLGTDLAAFTRVVRADEDENDTGISDSIFATSVGRIGRREGNPLTFYLAQDQAGAAELLGYYVWEGMESTRLVYECTLPHWYAYALELGDIVKLDPLPWGGGQVNLRVIGISQTYLASGRRIVGVQIW
jgi:hypothetical protein